MVHIEYDRVEWLAGQCDAAADSVTTGRNGLSVLASVSDLVPAFAFGNSDGAEACRSACQDAAANAMSLSDYLALSLEADGGRLRQVVSAFRQTDHETADEICSTATDRLNVYTTHVHSEGRGERGDDDNERAGQINEAADQLEVIPQDRFGPTIFTGDLNETRGSDTRTAGAIGRIEDELGYTDAGAHAGSTHPGAGRIDYTFASDDIGVSHAEVVDGGTSDHDALVTDMRIPPAWN